MDQFKNNEEWFTCPIPPPPDEERITLAHGEGARLTRQLIRERIIPLFTNPILDALNDGAILPTNGGRIAFTSDGYTVTPLFFPGGDIGCLSIFGTVNDLAVTGAVPKWMSLSLIVEEGLPWSTFDSVLHSIQRAAQQAGVAIVTGDTKVVPRGTCDQLFITTSGIGEVITPLAPSATQLQIGDVLIVSGPVGCHGAAILSVRDHLEFDPSPISDCASLADPLVQLYRSNLVPRSVRDATRGGVAAVLHEWSEISGLSCVIDESAVPTTPAVRAVCELLGLDPLHLANEGTCVIATNPNLVESTVSFLQQFAVTRNATVIGEICSRRIAPVAVRRSLGTEVALDDPSGAPLPRIC